jgi:N-acetylglucosamine malate deacetylase 2
MVLYKSMKKLLLVLAHPDDESFACGGVVAKYVEAGWKVELICATLGEAGDTGPFGDQTKEQLSAIRKKEMETAGTILGISAITFLGYKDGALQSEPSGEIEEAVYQKMLESVPDVVVTFNTTGISNHPDHVKMSYATTYAFQKYAAYVIDLMKERQTIIDETILPKLYYACMPESLVSYLKKKKNLPEESFGKPFVGTEDKLITTVINIKRFQSTKKRALLSHVSQSEDVSRFLSLPHHPFLMHEYFILRMVGISEVFMGKQDRVASRL